MSIFSKNYNKNSVFYQISSFFVILGILLLSQNLFAEGTKQLAPTSTDRVFIQPSPNGFAYYDGPADLRMKIQIANPNSEQVFLGFSRPATSAVYPCSGSLTNAYFRIKDPNGNVVFPTPGSNNGQILDGTTSNISTYAQAVAGPSTIVGGTGYTPFVFNPDGLPAGDYYVEFSSSIGSVGSSRINIDMFDITVATEGGSPTAIDGRVHAQIWSMYAPRIDCGCANPTFGCFDRPFNGKFNVYTPVDSVVIEIDFAGSGLQPAFFNVFFNSYGTANTGNVATDRQSLNSQQIFASEYEIFLNDPDENVYPSGVFGTYVEEPFFNTCNGMSGPNSSAVEFIATVTRPGQLEVLIDLNNTGDFLFTPNTEDVVVAVNIDPQPGELPPYVGVLEWDGLDGLGNPVDLTMDLTYRMKYSQAVVHFPIYDSEYMLNGFNVTTIRPLPPATASQVFLYYDDSNIPDATGNGSPKVDLNGCTPPCHTWSNFNYGNVNTINTYFFGSEERTFLSESATCLAQAIDDEDSTTVNVPVVIDVVSNDLGTNLDPTSVSTTGLMQPTNGTTTINPITGEITYTPNPGFVGIDMFEYEICDTDGLTCSTATVTVTVTMPTTETDCTDGFDNDGDGLTDCDDPDCELSPDCEQPSVGIAKSSVSTVNNGDGTYTVSFLFTVENFGNVDLSDLTIFDDVVGQFAGMSPTNFMAQNGTLTANSAWNGTATSNILNANQMLAVGATGTVSVSFDITPGMTQMADNEATAEGTSPLGEMTMDTSTDGTDADGDDGDEDPDEMMPTTIEFMENPLVGVAKNSSSTANNGDGTYDISFDFVIENFGDVDLSNLTLFDDIVGQFAGMSPTNFMAQNGTLTANSAWNGTAASNILNTGQSLNVGQSGTVSISFTVTPGAAMMVNNSATAGGTSPAGMTVNDTSTTGTDADGNDGDDTPDENDPTTVNFMENPAIGVAKNSLQTINNGDGTYDISFDFVIQNFGDVNLSNLTLFDDVFGQFAGMNPTNFTAIDGSLTANTGWNGTSTSNILAPGQSLNLGSNGNVSISFTVTPGMATTEDNLATAGGTSPAGDTTTDVSTSGINPDPNNDGMPDEMTPTDVQFSENPSMTVEKSDPMFTPLGNDIYSITYEFTIENTGDILLNSLEVYDDIMSQFASFSPNSYLAVDGSLLADNGWIGSPTTNVLQSGQSLAVGEIGTVSISFNVTLTGDATLTNFVNVSSTTPSGTTVTDDDTNTYEFTPPICPALTISLADNVICGSAETNITVTAEANSGQIGVYYTVDNQLDSTQLYQAGHGGATLLTTIAGSASGINETFASGPLENNGTAAVTYYIYAILNDGNPNISLACNVVAVDEITVNPTPNVIATTGGPYCEEENVQLFITGAQPGETFQWTGPNGYISTQQNPVIIAANTNNTGNYSAVVTNTSGCTFTTNTLNIVVNEMPDAPTVSNDSPVCANGSNDVTLSAMTNFTSPVNWFDSSNNLVGTGQTLTLNNVTAADAGNYYAIIDNGLCPSSPSAITEVIIDEIPTNQTANAGQDQIICNGESTINLNANTPATGIGTWSQETNNPAGAVIANPNNPGTLVTNLSAGNFTFIWSLSNGTCEDYSTDEMSVTVQTALTAPTISGDNEVCEGGILELTITNPPANVTYEWQGPNGFTATTQTITIDPVQPNNAGDYSVKILTADGCESNFSTPINVTVFPKPATPTILGNEICAGENIELQTGSPGDLFEWFSPSNALTPAATTTVNSVSIPTSNAGYQAGNWTLRITDVNGCQTDVSAPYNLVINSIPNAPTASYNDPICGGQNLQLMATTISGASYMWTGPNGYSSFQQNPSILNATPAFNGTYEVVAMIDGCASNASSVVIAVSENPTASPTNSGGACGTDLEIYANASGGVAPLSYVWTGPNSFFSTSQTPVIANPTSVNEGIYTLMVMDANGCSSEATTTVTLATSATLQPEISSNSPSCEGETLTISTAQYSGQSVTYEWTGPNGTSTFNGDYPNASTIVIPNATAVNAGDYTVFVSVNGCGSNTSFAHTVIINNTPTVNAITEFAGSCVDGQTDIQLIANAANGDSPYNYSWIGPNGFNSNSPNPTIDNATEADSGTYTVRVTDSNGCQSDISSINLNLADEPATPMIASPQMACFGEKVELTVTNVDASATYSWTFNGTAIPNNDSPILVIDPADTSDSGTYEVTVSKADCPPVSATVALTVSAEIMATVADQDFGCTDGATNITIASNVSGGIAPYTYVWTGPNGFSSAQAMPIIPNANEANSGTYNVIVTDDNGCTSGMISAVVSIKDAPDQPVFETLNNPACEGEDVVLSIQNYTGTTVVYNWTFNGNTLSNNSPTLIIENATAADNGTYAVAVNVDGCDTPNSASFDLTVNEALEVTVDNQNLTCIDNNTDLTLSANITTGTAPYTYQWSGPNGFTSNAASPVIAGVSAVNAGTYQVVVTDDNGCQSETTTAVIQITEAPDAPTLTASGNACAGSELILSTQSYTGTNVTYAWTKDGVSITNNSNILNINPATADDSGDYVVSVTVDGCTATPSNIATVEIFENPTISIAAVNAQNCTDGTTSITLDATPAGGSGIYTYSWTGPSGFTSTDQDPVLNNINASMAGNYTVQIFDNNGCQGAVASVAVAITDAPDQPQLTSSNINACEGEEVILSVDAVTGTDVMYNWSLNGNAIGNNSNQLIISQVALADAGDYEVAVTVDGCLTQSETLSQAVSAKPNLTIFPVNDLTCADGNTDVLIQTEVSTGIAPFQFTWTGPNGFSSIEQNPVVPSATTVDAGNYQVIFTDANGCTSTTESVTINVTDGIEQPTISTSNGAVCEGQQLTLSTTPYAGANVTYVWSKDGNPIQNNDMPTLSFTAVSVADNGNYNLTVTVDGCSNFANTFVLNIDEKPEVIASSSANNNTLECADGTDDIQLTAMTTSGTAPFTYSWTGPNGFASSVQNPTISGAMEVDAGTYQVVVTDANNCESSTASVELNITDGVAQPQIMANNASGNANTCEGEDVTLSVTAYTGANVTYAWTLNGAAIANNTNELIIQNAMAADAGDYEVMVTVDGCATTSEPFTVQVFATPVVSLGSFPILTCTDGSQDFQVDANVMNGSGVYSYAWTGPGGFTANTEDLIFPNATSVINGSYSLTVTDATGCVSAPTAIQVFIQDGINEPIVSATGPVCEGGEVTLEVTEYQGQNVNYEWTLNGSALPITGHQYPIQNAMIADAGDYQVTVTVNNCEAVSENFTLNVFGAPMVAIANVAEIPCADGTQDITLTTTVTGGIAPYIYAWEGPNGFTSTVASPTLSNVSSLQSGTYTVTVTDANNCGTNATSIEIVIGNGIDQPVIASNTGNVCEGENTQLSVQNYNGANVTYEWYLNNNLITTNTNQHFINAATTADAGTYRVVVTINDCEASSEEFALEIYTSPQVSIAAIAPIACSDGTQDITLQTTISAGTAPFIYEWTGPNGYASTVANPTLIDVTEADAGTYLVTVFDANNCAAATASVDVVISDGLDQPMITSTSAGICAGENVTLSVAEYAGANVTYEWFLNGISIGNNSNEYALNAVATTDGGDYTVTVNVDGCSATSSAFTQVIFEMASVSIDAVPTFGCTSGTQDIPLNATVTGGTAPYQYSWTGPNGFVSTNEDPTIFAASESDAGTYILNVTDANNCESLVASVEVVISDGLDQPMITSTSAGICAGENVTLSVAEYAGTNVTYEWFLNGTSIGNNSSTLNLVPATAADNGNYTVTVNVDGCTATAAAFTQTIFDQPTATIDNIPSFGCTDGTETAVINLNPTGGSGGYTFSWTGPNGFTSATEDLTFTGVTGDNAGTYTVIITDANNCESDPISAVLEVTDSFDQPVLTSSGPTCAGGEVTLSVEAVVGASVVYNWFKDGVQISNNTNELILNPVQTSDAGNYQVQITAGSCSEMSEMLTVEVYDQPMATIANVPAYECNGGTGEIQLNATIANGQAPYEYSWTGPNGFTSSVQSPTIFAPNEADAGTYTLIVTDANNCESLAAAVEVNISDAIDQPVVNYSGATCEGGNVTLSVNNYNGANVSYEWRKDGVVLGNNSNVLIISPVTNNDAGMYDVTVTVDGCSAQSEVIAVEIYDQPEVSISPLPEFACTDGTEDITFNPLVVGGQTPYTFVWTGPNGFNSTIATPTINAADENDAGTYTLTVTDANNCVAQSVSVELNISSSIDQPQIMGDGGAVCTGANATLSVPVYAGANVTYQWFKNGNTIGNNSNELNFTPAMAGDGGNYTVLVTVGDCSSTSQPYAFAVNPAPSASISLLDGAPDLNCTDGTADLTLMATLTGGATPFTYEWTGPNGFTSASAMPNLNNVSSANAGTYNLIVTDANNCASQTASFELNITDAPDEPQITSSGAACEGGMTSISVQNYAGANVDYTWIFNGIVLPNNTNELVFNPANTNNAGNYQVTVTIDGCSTVSDIFNLEIFDNPSVFITNVNPIECTDGTEDVTLNVAVSGGQAPYTFAWTGPNGFTSTVANPTLSNVDVNDAGTYILTVTDANNCASTMTSTELEITGVGNQPTITSSGPTCEGGTVTLSVNAAAGANVSYQWTRNGIGFVNNSNELIISPVTVADAGNYQVAITADGCTATSDNFNVEIYNTPTANISFNQPATCTDGTATLVLNSNVTGGTAPFTYEWTGPNGYTSFEDNPILTNISSANNGVYNLKITDANGCASATASANVTITDAPNQPVISATGPVCEGGNVTLTVNAYQGANVDYVWTLNGQNLNINNNQLQISAATTVDAGDYAVSVTVDGCTAASEIYTLEIFDEPTAFISDVPTFACTDGTEDLTFSVNLTGGQAPYTFTWTGPNGFTSTEFAPTIENVNEADAGTYILTVSDANGCNSDAVSVAVEVLENVQQPTIASSGPVCEGDDITLSTTALAGANVVYNWTKDGVALNINNPQIILSPAAAGDAGDYQVEVSVNNCSNTSPVLTVEVYEKPTATIASLNAFECTNGTENVTLNASVFGGSGIYFYQWTGPNGFQAAVQDPILNNLTEADAGTYLLTVTDNNGCASAVASVDLVVTDALNQPTISSSGAACAGEDFMLSITPVAGANYEWFFNGNSIGNNNPNLTINAATTANDGMYSVQVSTASCDVTSPTFFQNVGQTPSVFFDAMTPMDCVDNGENVTLQPIVSGGSGSYTFAWTGPNGYTSNLPNPTISATTANSGSYTVIVMDNSGCSSNPTSVEILITESISQPTISSTGPACEGETVIISTENYQGSNVTYAWTLNGNPIANNSNQIILSPATDADGGEYAVTVTVDGCSETSLGFTQTIHDKPVATIAPQEGANCTDGTEDIVLLSNVFGGDGNYTYEWTGPNGFNSAGQNAFLGNINASNSGTYTLIVTDGNGCVSNAVSVPLLISDAPDQPIITVEGASCEGGAVTLSVQPYAGANVTYVWRKDGVQIPNNSNILTINPATTADNGEYSVEVIVNSCIAFSNPIDVNVSGTPIVEIEMYDPIECSDGNDVITLGATVTGGSGNYTYEWTGPNGFQSFAVNPVLNGANAGISGTYNLTVTDTNGCASAPASTEIFITNGIDQPVIAYDGAVCQGEMVTLSVQQYPGANVTYTWFKDSVEVTSATTNQIVFNPITVADAGAYFVTVQSDDCSSSSNPVQVQVFEEPTVEIADIPTIFCVDGSLDIELDATITGGTAPYTYLWEGPGYFEVTEDALLTGVTSDDSGTYTLMVTDANGCQADLAVINVTFIDQIPQPVISSNSPVCTGELVEMTVPAYSGTTVEYVWTFNGQPVGENSPSLFIPNATLANAGNYQIEVIADGCSSLSPEHEVIVFENPTVEVTTGPSAFCTSGQDSLVINSNVTGGVAPFTYEWVGPNGFFSVNANPVLQNVNDDMDGSYTVFVTDANGCQSNAFTIEIDIEEGIVEPVITSTGQSCDGDEFTLSVPAYSGQNVTYEWSTPNGITTNITGLNSNEIIINPITAAHEGIYTITVTVDGCTNTSDEFNFFILDEPTANPLTATNDPICEGGDLELLANATGNGTLTYSWSGPNGFTSNVPNPTINNVNDSYDGQYLLVVTNQQGCSTTATLTVVNVILPAPPTPTLATNAPICDGEDLILETSTAGDMFAWVGPLGDSPSTLDIDGLMTTVGTTTLDANNESYLSGNWGVQVKDSNGCWSELSAPVEVTINEIPQAIATNGGAICAGGEAQLFANNIQNATYEWYIAGESNIISTQASPVISNIIEDTVFELFITLNGCSSEAASTLVEVLTAPEAQPEAAYFLNSDCSPSDLQLFANVATAGNFEFSWVGPNGFTSNLENPVIPNANEDANGIYELTISNGNGCQATYGTNLVSVIPNQVAQPIITANNVACAGETLILTTTQYAGSDIDYVWLQGTTIVASSNNNQLVINEITAANEGEYSVMVQVDGCVLTSNIINVEMLQQPTAAPSYTLNDGNCEGGSMQLSANAGNVSGSVTYEWTGPNGFTSNASNPFIPVTNVNNNGAYTVTITNSNGCFVAQSITVNDIEVAPNAPVASSNSPVCEGGEIILSVPQPSPGSPVYVWYNGLGQVIGNGQVLTITEGSADAISPYSVQLVENGCESDLSDAISVSTDALATPMLTVNDDVLCEGQPLVLNATAAASNSAIYTWFLDGNLLGTSANPTFIINSPNSANTGVYTVQINVTGCQSGVSNAVSVSIFGAMSVPTTANATSPTNPACDGSAVILTTPFIAGATYTWFGPNGYSSTNFNPVLTDISADDAGQYYVIVEVPGCATAVSATTTVYVQQALPVAMLANDGPYCEGDSATLTILNPIDLNPTDSVTYEWFDATTMVSIGITDTTFIGIADLDENQTGDYYVVMTLNGCTADASEPTFVNVASLPQNGAADAGEDIELCVGVTATLDATLPAGASGLWTSPTGATIFEPTAANSEIADLQVGDNVFVWTLSQGGCGEYALDTVIYNVAVVPADLAFAGADENLCGRTTIALDATTPTQAVGTWTQPDGQIDAGVTIVDANNPNTPINGLVPGTYEFYWSLTEGGCENYSADTVLITIMDGPTNNAYIAKDLFYACGEEEFTLTAEVPSEGEGIWTSNTGALIVNPTNPTTLVADLVAGENWFYWSLSAPDCPNYSVDSALIVVQDDLQGVEDLYNIAFNESIENINVLENDLFGNVTNYSFEVVTRPSHGTLIPLDDEGTFDYVPNANFFGFDTMQYVICNLDCPAVTACDTVTVSFLIGGTTAADDCFAPNLITPNGDGMNDALMFPCLAGGNFPNNNIMIFNRWGDKVYESKPYNNDWEGTYKGEPLPAGSYYYILMLEEGETPLTGFFTVVR